ncbi:hypothetical protein Pmani_015809 [Petrolisthes manimaculis]|uniref:Uncharacterized protein n=1 Tax=Petrolisthes manimaculis TaxID=1843537 RepID=A0AAE1U7C5_9EUCA|nr:hypothetical protein Pmani_015809 [Petrolisthes manimaculis]
MFNHPEIRLMSVPHISHPPLLIIVTRCKSLLMVAADLSVMKSSTFPLVTRNLAEVSSCISFTLCPTREQDPRMHLCLGQHLTIQEWAASVVLTNFTSVMNTATSV